MASNNPIAATNAALNQEIKEIKTQCMEMCNIITNNTPMEIQGFTPENLHEKALCYVDGVRTDLEMSETSVTSDSNLVTSQFLTELDKNISQIEELIAYERGLLRDVDTEIMRLNHQIKIANKAKNMRQSEPSEVRPEHLARARNDFAEMKKQLQGLIHSLFPNEAQEMTDLLADLMKQKLENETGGYIELDPAKFPLVRLLKDMGVVVPNPYTSGEIKLAY